ncbi:hypothetical protein [Cytobacillus oceanisediminis]|uniref:hypothetical protein n=1 Tax=Cytobacillus oceanisediminis TaxID=665099 RepID=UPI00203E8C19|nr:hypothetical protein [Cytobacillus oceanisediminis]MCM3405486.1 hypothetical protein [Cytobacillus oceanisediminis]
MEVKDLIKILETKYKSSKGFMGVNLDGVTTPEDLFENVKDEILVIEDIIENSYIEHEEAYDMTEREAKGYVKKLNNFLTKYEKMD